MSQHRTVIGLVVIGIITVGWYLFRPELLFIDRTVDEALTEASVTAAASQQTILATGTFHNVAHETKGMATLHTFVDGKRLVRLSAFETSNGPDVRVYLVAANNARDNDTVTRAGFVDLGALKGNKGDQNYEVPPEVNLEQYGALTTWCRRFGVNFATAPLTPQQNI